MNGRQVAVEHGVRLVSGEAGHHGAHWLSGQRRVCVNSSSACSSASCHWSMNEEGACRFAYVTEVLSKEARI